MGPLEATLLTITVLVLTNLSTIQGQTALSNPMVSSILRNLMTPGKPDSLQALLKMAAARKRSSPVLPSKAVLPTNVITQSNAMLQTNGIINNRMVQNPKLLQPIAQPALVEYPQIARLPVQQIEVTRTMPVTSQVVIDKAPSPAPLVNPFLPAASPVSALAPPTSNLLPPADINNPKCTFLRKIPIPPPTL